MPIDRRGFLLGSGGAVAAAAQAGFAAKAMPPNDTANIKLSVATYSFRKFPRDVAIQNIQALNVKYCDIKEFHLPYKDSKEQSASRSEAVRRCWDYRGRRRQHHDELREEPKLRAMFDYAKACGFPMMIIAPRATNMGTDREAGKGIQHQGRDS